MATFTNTLQNSRTTPPHVGRMSPHRLPEEGVRTGRRAPRKTRGAGERPHDDRPISLLDETRRRTKSNMQSNLALLHLCPEGGEQAYAEAMLTEMENRLQSMAERHRARCRSGNLDRIDLAVFLRQSAMLRNSPSRSPLAGGWILDPSRPSLLWSREEDDPIPGYAGRPRDLQSALAQAPEKWRDHARRAIYASVVALPPAMFHWRSPLTESSAFLQPAQTGEVGICVRPRGSGVAVEVTLCERGPGLPSVFDPDHQRALELQLSEVLALLFRGSLENGAAAEVVFEVRFAPTGIMKPAALP